MSIRAPFPRLVFALPALLALAACGDPKPKDAAPPVATVDGRPISANTFEFYVNGVTRGEQGEVTAERRAELLDSLVRAEVIAGRAEASGLADQPETRAMLDLSRFEILQQAAQQAWIRDNPVTDEELQAEYEAQVKLMPQVQYRARHILVATEDFARRLITRLDRGADFADLAKRESVDLSKENGGDLDWFTPDRMVAPFAQAVTALQPGEYTRTPVQTQYGWHIIKLEGTRPTTPPPMDSVRDRLKQVVEARKFRAHVDTLLQSAKVEKNL